MRVVVGDEISSRTGFVREALERAKGIVMAQRNVSEDDAWKLMRSVAMSRKEKVIEVAKRVIEAV